MTATEDTYALDLAAEVARLVIEQMPDSRPLLTIEQAATRLGESKRTVEERMARGELGWVQTGRPASPGSRKIEQVEIDRFIAERRVSVDLGEDEGQ